MMEKSAAPPFVRKSISVFDGRGGEEIRHQLSDAELPYNAATRMFSHQGLWLRLWQIPWYPQRPKKPEEWGFYDLYSFRDIFFAIDRADTIVCTGTLIEWRANYCPDDDVDLPCVDIPCIDYFRIIAEALSHHATEISEVVWRMWGSSEPYQLSFFEAGNLLIFDRLRINASSPAESAAIWELIVRLIRRRKNAQLLLLKAFPLEFEKLGPDDFIGGEREHDHKLQVRKSAMQRLYRSRLGVQALPGKYHDWMWRALGDYVPKPKLVRRKDPIDWRE